MKLPGLLVAVLIVSAGFVGGPDELDIPLEQLGSGPATFDRHAGSSRMLTWWLPPNGDAFAIPVSAGLYIDAGRKDLVRWLRDGSPWPLTQLPAFGVRYGRRMLVVIVPWPHYAELVAEDRLGIRFQFPVGRNNATPCRVVATWAEGDPLEVARVFRQWRRSAADTGAIPRSRSLGAKAQQVPGVTRLYGAPHLYLWGSALFSRFDVRPGQWPGLAGVLDSAPPGSFPARLVSRFTDPQRKAVKELAAATGQAVYLEREVALGVERALQDASLLNLASATPVLEMVDRNRSALVEALGGFLEDPASWGDGPSRPLLESLHQDGISRALLLLSDFYGKSPRPDLAARADALGYLLGPYDSYHSVHPPDLPADRTWETAQFDREAFEEGRVVNADGSGHRGFQGVGFHLSPLAALPYVRARVGPVMEKVPFSTWFVDCDATAECFDDYSPAHPASRVDDMNARRQRLRWLESTFGFSIGSEDGSVLVGDLIAFGHGVQTPYLGHLDPAFRDRKSPYFLGGYWPPDAPDIQFKAVPAPPSVVHPYFDPRVRIPLYQAALGDEVIGTHHWGFDSMKFSDLAMSRELMEILYMVPPLYHVSRGTWPGRRGQITRHVRFWSPLHRQLSPVTLVRFEWVTGDRLVQRTTFLAGGEEVTVTVNFDGRSREECPPFSATVGGNVDTPSRVYRASPG